MILPSSGNTRRRGILIDWDLSRLECELGIGPVEPDRTVRLSSIMRCFQPLRSSFVLLGDLAVPLSIVA